MRFPRRAELAAATEIRGTGGPAPDVALHTEHRGSWCAQPVGAKGPDQGRPSDGNARHTYGGGRGSKLSRREEATSRATL